MPLRLYYDIMSQPSRAVYIFLQLNNVPFEGKPIALRKGEQHSEEYKKINPFSKVPAIDDDGFLLTESMAIIKYIIHTRGLSDRWTQAADPRKNARVEEYLQWYHVNTRFQAGMLFLNLILPRVTGKPVDHKAVREFREKVATMVSQLESYFLKDRKYLGGDELTIADIFGACELMQLHCVQEHGTLEKSAAVKAWLDRVRAETNPYFDEAHKLVLRTGQVFKDSKAKL